MRFEARVRRVGQQRDLEALVEGTQQSHRALLAAACDRQREQPGEKEHPRTWIQRRFLGGRRRRCLDGAAARMVLEVPTHAIIADYGDRPGNARGLEGLPVSGLFSCATREPGFAFLLVSVSPEPRSERSPRDEAGRGVLPERRGRGAHGRSRGVIASIPTPVLASRAVARSRTAVTLECTWGFTPLRARPLLQLVPIAQNNFSPITYNDARRLACIWHRRCRTPHPERRNDSIPCRDEAPFKE